MLRLGQVLAVGMVVGLLAGGCGGGDDDATPPTTRQVSTTVDPFAVPDPIDVAYVERVMAALNRVYGDAAREAKVQGSLTERFDMLLASVYATDEALELARNSWEIEQRASFRNVAESPDDPVTRVETLIVAEHDCVVAAVDRDRSPLLAADPGDSPEQLYVVLVPLDPARDRRRLNPAGWALALDGFLADESVPGEAECDVG